MKTTKLLWIILFNLIIIVSEVVFGLISNSFALIADALHNTGDVIALVITYIALKLGTRQTTFKYTFGFIKAEMMAAFVNTLFLLVTMLYLMYEAVGRFYHPQIIEPLYMIIVGFIALIANGISAYLLNKMGVESCASHEHHHHHHHEHEEDANIKSAYLHMLSDALISVGVVIAGIFIYYFKIYYIDSILTIFFSVYIIRHSYPLLRKSFLSLMDANSVEISKESLDEIIVNDNRVIEYHDLHISKPSSKHNFISFHIVLEDSSISLEECKNISNSIKLKLEKVGFNHILIQVDTIEQLKNSIQCNITTS